MHVCVLKFINNNKSLMTSELILTEKSYSIRHVGHAIHPTHLSHQTLLVAWTKIQRANKYY